MRVKKTINNYPLIFVIIILLFGSNNVCVASDYQKQADNTSLDRVKCVVLKKNIVNGVNYLTQEMLTQCGSNTKFIIKYDFVVDGDLVVPDNCELVFKRGSLRGGRIDFNKCRIVSKNKAFYGVRFSNIQDFNIKYFDIPQDATFLLQDIVSSCTKIDLGNNTFNINKVISVEGNSRVIFICNGVINALEGFDINEGEGLVPKGTMLYVYGINSGSIKNIKLNGNRNAQRGIFCYYCNNLIIDNCEVHSFDGKDKAPSWGVRCQSCNNIELINSHIYDVFALPVGVVGRLLGSSKGVVFEHTYNSCINNNTIENVQSTKDGDALQIIDIPSVNGDPMPTREDLYKNVDVIVSNNIIKANDNSKRCIKIQAFGVKVVDNFIQKLYVNTTNTVSIYGSNVTFSNNRIDSREFYTIGLGTSALSLHDVVISNNTIYHNSESDWCSCIYILGSSMKDCLIDSNIVYISNSLNYFCDLREGVNSFVVSNNKVIGGRQCFRIYVTKDNAEIKNLQLIGNYYEGDNGFLIIREKGEVKADFHSISAADNTFNGVKEGAIMFDCNDNQAIKKSISLGNNSSNRSLGL